MRSEVHVMRRARPWPVEEDALMLHLWRQDDTIPAIAFELGRSEGSVRTRLGELRKQYEHVGRRRPGRRKHQ